MFAQALYHGLGHFRGAGAGDEGDGAGDDGVIAESALQGGEDFEFVGDFGHGGCEPALLLARCQQPGQVADPESHKRPRGFGVVVL